MDKAKQAVHSLLSKDGKHDTTVHETVNPAVKDEHVTRTQHENATKVVDREVHQDHHHTSVQPIKDREVLPEEQHHRIAAAENRNIHHGDTSQAKSRVAADAAQFKNTCQVGDVQHSSSAGQTVTGEHVHHHIHENIQPVIHKETVQPSVVHTTVPVHEVHHNEAKHHTSSALPAMSMDEYKQSGGAIGGRDQHTDTFRGEPKNVEHNLGRSGATGSNPLTGNESSRHGDHTRDHNSSHAGVGSGVGSTGAGTHSSGLGSNTAGTHSSGLGSNTAGTHSSGLGSNTTGTHAHDSTSTTHGKPTLMDKINPKKDADHDGKAGFMK